MLSTESEGQIKIMLENQISATNSKIIYRFDRWQFFELNFTCEDEIRCKRMQYNIIGDINEKIIVRIHLDHKNEIIKARYYYLLKTDAETANYMFNILLQKINLKFPVINKHTITSYNF